MSSERITSSEDQLPPPLFADDFFEPEAFDTPESTDTVVTPSTRRAAREMVGKTVTLRSGTEKYQGTPPNTVHQLIRDLQLAVPSELGGDDVYNKVSQAYQDLGGNVVNRAAPDFPPRDTELLSTLKQYQGWYTEFDLVAESGVLQVGDAYRSMDEAHQNAYFLHIFSVIDQIRNRIGLIAREEGKPSQNPDVQALYKNHSDDELTLYAEQLAALEEHVLETQAAQAMLGAFHIHREYHTGSIDASWYLHRLAFLKAARPVEAQKRIVRFINGKMTFTAPVRTKK